MTDMRDKVSEILAGLDAVRDSHSKLGRALAGGPASFYFEKIKDYIDGLFGFAKFQIGSRVCLAADYDCSDAPGWNGCQHFLKRGAAATVQECDFRKGRFVYAVEFDRETWMDGKIERPVSSKHTFTFAETHLVPIEPAMTTKPEMGTT
jgi:hypothetical protein